MSVLAPKDTKSLIKEGNYQQADGLELRETGSKRQEAIEVQLRGGHYLKSRYIHSLSEYVCQALR